MFDTFRIKWGRIMKLRISFDLDQTLISQDSDWQAEPDLEGFRGGKWRLRKGAVELFEWIREHDHEIWIYTNSYTGWTDIASWFQNCGIPVDGVINQIVHDQKRNAQDPKCDLEKNPKWFGIDLHFDDLDELAKQGRIYKIDPLDFAWTDKVKKYINEKTKTKAFLMKHFL
jgi:hypothetical protein